eukprot:Hpha_TRINITY_DN6741_c0_g2::TRINITY_DN6741_c0_g2_i1::g.111107::m.111107
MAAEPPTGFVREKERARQKERDREASLQEEERLKDKLLKGALLDGEVAEPEVADSSEAVLQRRFGSASRGELLERVERMLEEVTEEGGGRKGAPTGMHSAAYVHGVKAYERVKDAMEKADIDRSERQQRAQDDDQRLLMVLAHRLTDTDTLVPAFLHPGLVHSSLRKMEALLRMKTAARVDVDALLAEVAAEEDHTIPEPLGLHPSIKEKDGVYYLNEAVDEPPTTTDPMQIDPKDPSGRGRILSRDDVLSTSPNSGHGSEPELQRFDTGLLFDRSPLAKPPHLGSQPTAPKTDPVDVTPVPLPGNMAPSEEPDEATEVGGETGTGSGEASAQHSPFPGFSAGDGLPGLSVPGLAVEGTFARRLSAAGLQEEDAEAGRRVSGRHSLQEIGNPAERDVLLVSPMSSRASARRVSNRILEAAPARTPSEPEVDRERHQSIDARRESIKVTAEELVGNSTCERCRELAAEVAALRDRVRQRDEEIVQLKAAMHARTTRHKSMMMQQLSTTRPTSENELPGIDEEQTKAAATKQYLQLKHANELLQGQIIELQRLRLESVLQGKGKRVAPPAVAVPGGLPAGVPGGVPGGLGSPTSSPGMIPPTPLSATHSYGSPDLSPAQRRKKKMDSSYTALFEQALRQVQYLNRTRRQYISLRERMLESYEREAMFQEDKVLALRRKVQQTKDESKAKRRWNFVRARLRQLVLHKRVIEVLNYALYCEGGPRHLLHSALLRVTSLQEATTAGRRPGTRWALTTGALLGR